MRFLAATSPKLFEIVEDRLSLVVVASVFTVLLLKVVFAAPLVYAPKLPLLCHEFLLP
jgi:hypothetical protein